MIKPFIDPELQTFLDAAPTRPPLTQETLSAFRATAPTLDHKVCFPNSSPAICHALEGPGGLLEVYEFRPSEVPQSEAAILWLHGGGYVTGHGNDVWFGSLFAEKARVRVFSVHYRLAPEHPFPAALDDGNAALKWLFDQSEHLGIDASRIAIGGASAGGGLATALGMFNNDSGGPRLAFQLLLYPMIDHRHDNPAGNMDVPRFPKANSFQAWQMYLGQAQPQTYAVPSLHTNLSGLPPTFLTVGEADLFLDDIRDFSKRLNLAGVPQELRTYPGVYHAAEIQGCRTAVGRTMTRDYVTALVTAVGTET